MEQKNIYGEKPNPFENVLGDSPELRVIQEMLPLMGRTTVDNDETYLTFEEIRESTGVQELEFATVLAKFIHFGMILTRETTGGDDHEYALDKTSSIVEILVHLDNALINVILEKEFPGNPT